MRPSHGEPFNEYVTYEMMNDWKGSRVDLLDEVERSLVARVVSLHPKAIVKVSWKSIESQHLLVCTAWWRNPPALNGVVFEMDVPVP